uniref:Tumor protein p53-inducible nuclear protein 1 n=1 Tax=Clastoptera arizonana TaxID=38151 RepID=A0A1B6BWE5_9HEMI
MFNNLANYLLGYNVMQSSKDEEICQPETSNISLLRLRTVEVEDSDWLLVNNGEMEDSDENDLLVQKSSPLISSRKTSRSESVSSLPCLSMDESWFVTPPPCFTLSGPIVIETSSLENLLIEHPSMSVYHHRSPPQHLTRSTSSVQSEEINQQPVQALRSNNRNQPIHLLQKQQHILCLELKASCKVSKHLNLRPCE